MKTVDPDQYDRLLRAQFASNQLVSDGLERSVALYREILDADPSFAPAWAGLAVDYGLLGFFTLSPPEAAARAEEAATKALELDPELALAYNARGFVEHFFRWRWREAEASYRRALELNPNDASTHHRLWGLLAPLGRWDEADAELAIAARLDPLSVSIANNLGQNRWLHGDFDGATEALERALRLQPDYAYIHGHLWLLFDELKRDPERGRHLVLLVRNLGFEESAKRAEVALATKGYRSAVEEAARGMAAEFPRVKAGAYTIAELFSVANEPDEAIAWLRRGYVDHAPEMPWIGVARSFLPLRDRPEFKELLEGIHLKPQDGRKGADPGSSG